MALGRLTIILVLLVSLGCTHGNCRRKEQVPPYPGANNETQDSAKKPTGQSAGLSPVDQRVKVYKYDGSLQCGAKKGANLKVMEKELSGIEVFSKEKKADGLMHIQVCGSGTGMANLYEILAKDLTRAEKRGFQLWKFE